MPNPPGAHGLFAATGKKPKPVHVRDDDGNIVKVAKRPRQEHDFEPTPPEPTRAFCQAEMIRIKQFNQILECAAGDGRMARDLEECTGLKVLMSDLIDRGCDANICDFYDFTSLPANTCIITNPPFDQCHHDPKWVRHALEVLEAPYLALLLPLSWLGTVEKQPLWRDHRPARIYLMRWRIDWTGMGSNPSLNAWYVWDSQHDSDECFMRMIDKVDDPRQQKLL